jgi:hypothetical protein
MNQDEHKDLPAFIIVSPADIAARAYEIYQDRGAADGFECEDWRRAEEELKAMPAARRPLARPQSDATVLERTEPAATSR